MKEAMFWELKNDKINCKLCSRHCTISEGKFGTCGVRTNKNNRLYSTNYGRAATINVDPIGKKPLFHFNPGTLVLSLGTSGCNLRCDYCQNYNISQAKIDDIKNIKVTPKKILTLARKNECKGVAWTYNEPTVWYEFVLESASFLKSKGLFNVFITNGYIEKEPLTQLAPQLDAVNVDIKGFSDEFYQKIARAHLKPVLDTCRLVKELGIHTEISYLLVPPLNNDDKEIKHLSRWIINILDKNTPLHFLRFFPVHKLKDIPVTPTEALTRAQEIASDEGLNNVYINNLKGGKFQDTFCPKCKETLIHREDFQVVLNRVKESKTCPRCSTPIHMITT